MERMIPSKRHGRLALRLQLLYALRKEPIGRRKLAQRTALTEMVVRQTVERMQEAGLVRIEKRGVTLTDHARERYATLFSDVRAIEPMELGVLGRPKTFLVTHLCISAALSAWLLRDICLASGGTGLILLSRQRGMWRFSHDQEPFTEHNPRDAARLETVFGETRDGDSLLAVTATDRRHAGAATWAVLASLLSLGDPV